MSRWEGIARSFGGDDYAAAYARHFAELAEQGQDINGEVTAATALVPAPARVLDAGCGTGRSTIAFAALGYDVTGVDVDERMLDQARAEAPDLDWRQADLATLDLGERFDLVLVAGNVIALLEPGTLGVVAERLARHTRGTLICGFGLDAGHLPPGCPLTPLADYDTAMSQAGFTIGDRWSTWEADLFDDGDGYVVTVHRIR